MGGFREKEIVDSPTQETPRLKTTTAAPKVARPGVPPPVVRDHQGLGQDLDAFFFPKAVALIGASDRDNSVGKTVLINLIKSSFGGNVYPVNNRKQEILGVKSYPDVVSIPEKCSLALICIPAKAVPAVMEDCGKAGVKGVIIISAGFAEEQMGEGGQELLRKVVSISKKYGIRIVGPNCLGTICTLSGLNASFGQPASVDYKGSVALVSQSGALITAVVDYAHTQSYGFSHVVSMGSMCDVSWADVLDYLAADARCKAIVCYMEGVGDARSFMAAAQRATLIKPVLIIKAGRTDAGAKAAASHTGSMTGGDAVFDAALARAGVLRLIDAQYVFFLSHLLNFQPLPLGPNMAIITNAGGPGILCADALSAGQGALAALSPETHKKLNTFLPDVWSHANPVDIIGDATADHYGKTTEAVLADPSIDGAVVILTPQAMTQSTESARRIVDLLGNSAKKPIIAAWMGGDMVAEGAEVFRSAGVPVCPYPDMAAQAFNYLWQYSSRLRSMYEPCPIDLGVISLGAGRGRKDCEAILKEAQGAGQRFLSEYDSKRVMACYDIPVTPMALATTPDEAVTAAEKFGYPVVVKLHSYTITHKADVGGVHLNLRTAEAVKVAFEKMENNIPAADFLGATVQPMLSLGDGFECIIGSNEDGQFGPVVLFGTGGGLVEVYKDRALGLPPLSGNQAYRMIMETKVAATFKGVRGRKPVDVAKVVRILVNFSHMVLEQPLISEIDINPLFCSGDSVIALDARVVIREPNAVHIPTAALRPYPYKYISSVEGPSGQNWALRPLSPDDEPAVNDFLFFNATIEKQFAPAFPSNVNPALQFHRRAVHVCYGGYETEICFGAFADRRCIGLARVSKHTLSPSTPSFGLVVLTASTDTQRVSTALATHALHVAAAEGLDELVGSLPEGLQEAVAGCRAAGFVTGASDHARITVSAKVKAAGNLATAA